MGKVLLLIGLMVELSGVVLMAASNITKMKIREFPLLGSPLQRQLASAVAACALVGIPIVAYLLRRVCWPWLVFGLSIVAWIACLPALLAYAERFSAGIGEPRDEDKLEQLHVQGLCVLALGFCLQTLAAALNP